MVRTTRIIALVKFGLLGVAIQMGKECNNHIGEQRAEDWIGLDFGAGEDITQASRRGLLRENALVEASRFSKKCPASLCIGAQARRGYFVS